MAQTVKFLSPQFLSASTLIGADVKNPQDESLGELKDVMISTTSGKIAFGVLSFGGMLGMGNKLFAVPWEAFRVDGGNERVVLDVPKERLKDAPGFDKDHWPNFADPTVATQVQTYYQR
ncbi:MAG TPA: PRC-barrel domain-containing protein [Rhodanobacteraceae bacterium]|nr:PRC-barrel domain-containing protein [Rhodanobacteraceae bacterium]